MNINWKWNAPVSAMFRIAAGVLCILFIAMGVLILYSEYQDGSLHKFDHSAKAGVAMLIWGIFFLTVAIRGRFVKRDIG
jgi:hypothetical protein